MRIMEEEEAEPTADAGGTVYVSSEQKTLQPRKDCISETEIGEVLVGAHTRTRR